MSPPSLRGSASDPIPTFRTLWRHLTSVAVWKRLVRRTVISSFALILLGYLSNPIASPECEADTRDWLSDFYTFADVPAPLHWVPPSELYDYYAINPSEADRVVPPWTWRSRIVGLHQYFPQRAAAPPWAYAFPAFSRFPYLVTVNYGCLAKDLYGEAGVRLYIAFFRWHVLVAQWPMWYS